MNRFFRAIVPNITVALAIALLTVLVVNVFNPNMGFVSGTPFRVLAALLGVFSLITGLAVYAEYRKDQ